MNDQMRASSLSLILAATLLVSGASAAGSLGSGAPHAGLFPTELSQLVVMAGR